MTKLDFYVEDFKEIESAARLERKSFFAWTLILFKRKREQKRLGALRQAQDKLQAEIAAQKINFIDIKI